MRLGFRPTVLGMRAMTPPGLVAGIGGGFIEDTLGINLGGIGTSIGIAAGGVGTMLVSKLLPSPADTVGLVAGVGLLGLSAYTLFSSFGDSKEETKPSGAKRVNFLENPAPEPYYEDWNWLQYINLIINRPAQGLSYNLWPWEEDIEFQGVVSDRWTGPVPEKYRNGMSLLVRFEIRGIDEGDDVKTFEEWISVPRGGEEPFKWMVPIPTGFFSKENIVTAFIGVPGRMIPKTPFWFRVE